MKHRLLPLLLAFVLSLACFSPALAAEGEATGFTDVAPDAWYAQAVSLCAENGIMVGTGEGVFSPDEALSYNQCLILALRLYDLYHGGDGVLDAPPSLEPENPMILTLADGTELISYDMELKPLPGSEETSFNLIWDMLPPAENGYLSANLEPTPGLIDDRDEDAWMAAQQVSYAWGKAHEGAATVQVNGMTIPGTVNCWTPWKGYVLLSFHPDDGDDSEGSRVIHKALLTDDLYPDAWWRDGAWYILQHGDLTNRFEFRERDFPADRWDFAELLFTGVGKLPAVRQVDIPDQNWKPHTNNCVNILYDAGILTGTDAYGTFNGDGQLTRAQAAVMVARVLDESQRVTAPLEPLPTEGYTLTYLMDGVPDSGVKYPVCILGGKAETQQGQTGILLLDGTLLPWPEGSGRPSYALETPGDYVYFGVYDETTEDPDDCRTGLIDRNGQFVVPLENMRTADTYAIKGGFFSEVRRPDGTRVWTLLDEAGQLIQESRAIPVDPRGYFPPKARQPFRGIEVSEGGCYLDANGTPISQKFDWAGHITDDGQGFVGLDGKIYRIDFAQ